MAIRLEDRVLIVSSTGSGKSVLAGAIWRRLRCRRLLIDPKGEHRVPGIRPARSVGRLDLSAQVAHYVPNAGTDDEFEHLFERVWATSTLGPRAIWLDESFGITRPGRCPLGLRLTAVQGRQRKQLLLACSTRPVNIEPTLRTEATHVIIFDLTQRDIAILAPDVGLEPTVLERELRETQRRFGPHAHLWWDRRVRRILRCPPLTVDGLGAPEAR